MADVNINTGFARFSTFGGKVVARVNKVHEAKFTFNGKEFEASADNKMVELELPSGQATVQEFSALSFISEDEFKASITEIIESLASQYSISTQGEKMTKEQIEQLEASHKEAIAKVSADLEAAKAELAELKTQAQKDKEAVEAVTKERNDLKAKADELERNQVALQRYDELSNLNAADQYGNREDALETLAKMSEDTYNAVKAVFEKVNAGKGKDMKEDEEGMDDKSKSKEDTDASVGDVSTAAVTDKGNPVASDRTDEGDKDAALVRSFMCKAYKVNPDELDSE